MVSIRSGVKQQKMVKVLTRFNNLFLLNPLWWRITENKKNFTTRTALSENLRNPIFAKTLKLCTHGHEIWKI